MESDRHPSAPEPSGVSSNAAISIVSNLFAGILVYGGLGALLGHWLGHEALFMAGGVLVGVALSLYLVNARLRLLPEPGRRDGDTAARGGR